MYEGQILQPGAVPEGDSVTGEADGLRALSWGELSARIGAAHDFRRVLGNRQHDAGGSFNTSSAQHLAALGEGKPDINPFDLSNGKAGSCITADVNSDQTTRDRGR